MRGACRATGPKSRANPFTGIAPPPKAELPHLQTEAGGRGAVDAGALRESCGAFFPPSEERGLAAVFVLKTSRVWRLRL